MTAEPAHPSVGAMLQVRTARIGPSLQAMRAWVLAADPGLVNLTLATRGTLAVFLSGWASVLVGRATGLAPFIFASGVTLSLLAPFFMREPTRRARQRTLLFLTLPTTASTLLTTLLHGRGPAGDACFLVVVFLCVLVAPRGPRMIGAGLTVVVTTYVGLYLELPPDTLPLQLLSIAAAIPLTALACFVIVPMNPVATLRHMVTAVQWRAARVLGDARRVADAGPAADRALARLRHDLYRLNAAALLADDQLTLVRPEGREAMRATLLRVELATRRITLAVREAKPGGRHALRLALHERRMRRGKRYVMPPERLERDSLLGQLVELGHAVHALGQCAETMAPARDAAAPKLPPGPLAWRLAARVTLAAALAMAGGMALSPQRWFWAVITVYVVFLNTRSRGDTIYKGVQRLAGTLLGIFSGLVLATLLGGDPSLEAAALLLSVFGMFVTFAWSYWLAIFCVTVMLGLLYGMLGAPLETVLVLRMEETAIGAAAAMFVAFFVLPLRTRDQVLRSARGVLTALAASVRVSRDALLGLPEAAPAVAIRQVDRQVGDLRLALAPISARRALFRRAIMTPRAAELVECVHWARVLAAASQPGSDPDLAGIAAKAEMVAQRLETLGAGAVTLPVAPSLGEGRPGSAVALALERLGGAVDALAARMQSGVPEEFDVEG